jgi:hypothetical protein
MRPISSSSTSTLSLNAASFDYFSSSERILFRVFSTESLLISAITARGEGQDAAGITIARLAQKDRTRLPLPRDSRALSRSDRRWGRNDRLVELRRKYHAGS